MKEKFRFLEPDIKALTLNYLRDRGIIDENSIIMSELTVGNFARRVDLAIYNQGKLLAFEIKSEADSLSRLSGQIDKYLEYFDKVIVVSDKKFTALLTENLPKNVALWEVNNSKIKVKQRGQLQRKIESAKLIDMMDLTDLNKLSSKLEIKTESERKIIEKSLDSLSNKALRQGVETTLRRKFSNVTKAFMKATVNREVVREDIKILSRFGEHRERIKLEKKQSRAFWDNIEQHAADFKKFAETSA
ncbi:sce7726 family protein [Vibrio harveyi]|uniref:sce7726 family protein n=1 Tax=Vibrio harveyi TaxID=669 RepID=UPI0006817543|nr:sce7726 family protein [Vibrio harveyi]WDZ72882.1 sce7726 family protein [Vibrio harveyi]HDM8070275.1 sce7726 family protein [Vibrio harveyi]